MNQQDDDARTGMGGGLGEEKERSSPAARTTTSPTATSTTMGEAYQKAVSLLSSDPVQALQDLQQLQERVASLSLFSKNEALEDISTGSLPLVALEHHLAMAYTQQPMIVQTTTTTTNSTNTSRVAMMRTRQGQLHRACDLWMNFLQRIEQLELFEKNSQEQKEYERLQEMVTLITTTASSSGKDADHDESPAAAAAAAAAALLSSAPCNRDVKIARYQAKQQALELRDKYVAMQQRRQRLHMQATDEMDGHDDESLSRLLALQSLEIGKHEALEELQNTLRELPMIARMIQQQDESNRNQSRYNAANNASNTDTSTSRSGGPPGGSGSSGPLKLTHITKNNITGQLQVRREEVQSQVFRRGWNQPTMSLQELAEREVAAALEREERQKKSEAAAKDAPRRYEQLVKDGMEDNVDLVEASAVLDRKWDDWKDENPRGSGNKRGNVGDRNF
jgi:immunoglobulin-binding protein 1